MNDNTDSMTLISKVLLAWVIGGIGNMTLSRMTMWAALLYSLVQTYFLMRDKWWRERK